MKTYLVSLTSNVPGVKENYLDSISNLDDSVIPVMVSFKPYFKAKTIDFKVIKTGKAYPNNLKRFDYFPEFEDDNMIIFTDTSDVIFQKPIPKLESKIYVSPELDTWGANNWWKFHLNKYNFKDLDGKPIFCMGTWAMPYSEVKSLLKFIKNNAHVFDDAFFSDQILFNWWLLGKKFEVHPTLFGTLYSSYSKGIIKLDHGIFYDNDDGVISIIHVNGNNKQLLKGEI